MADRRKEKLLALKSIINKIETELTDEIKKEPTIRATKTESTTTSQKETKSVKKPAKSEENTINTDKQRALLFFFNLSSQMQNPLGLLVV